VGGIADTLGLTNRPGARTPKDVITNPRGLEHVARAALVAPAVYFGGRALAPAAAGVGLGTGAIAGNIAAAGAVGAGEAALRGDNALYAGILDAIVAGLTEGTISGVSSLPKIGLKELGAPARAFKWATEAPGKALDAIAARLPSGKWFNVPSLSSKPLSVKDAVDKLKDLEGLPYQQARAELANEMTRLDMQRISGPKPFAGQVFKAGTSKERYQSPGLGRAKAAEAVRGVVETPATRAAADALAIENPTASMGLALSAPDSFGSLASHALRAMVP